MGIRGISKLDIGMKCLKELPSSSVIDVRIMKVFLGAGLLTICLYIYLTQA